jgi:DNA-binding CsgD family transcriptional regulator
VERPTDRLAVARRLVSGDLSCEEYREALAPERRRHGDMRLLLTLLSDRGEVLSPRELEIIHAAAVGETIDDTADRLRIGTETVKTYRKRARKCLGAVTMANAVWLAVTAGKLDEWR